MSHALCHPGIQEFYPVFQHTHTHITPTHIHACYKHITHMPKHKRKNTSLYLVLAGELDVKRIGNVDRQVLLRFLSVCDEQPRHKFDVRLANEHVVALVLALALRLVHMHLQHRRTGEPLHQPCSTHRAGGFHRQCIGSRVNTFGHSTHAECVPLRVTSTQEV